MALRARWIGRFLRPEEEEADVLALVRRRLAELSGDGR
jgi:hypothetical protein